MIEKPEARNQKPEILPAPYAEAILLERGSRPKGARNFWFLPSGFWLLASGFWCLVSSIWLLAGLGPAFGAAMVIGAGPAQACYQAARADRSDLRALEECNIAFDGDLTRADRTATRVNRGIILINRRQADAALADFDRAIRMNPALGEAHVNRGAALMLKNEYEEAVEAITRGIGLNTEEAHKAHYNRAIAYEALGDVRAAYDDYTRAAELAPEWQEPRTELARFTVRRR